MSSLPTLRPYQLQVIDEVRTAIKAGKRRILVVVPTGGGKTTIGGSIIHGATANGHSVLWMAHRKELVDQAYERISCRRSGFGISAGIIMANTRPNRRQMVQVASIQTLLKRELPAAKIILVDEAHHSVSPSFLKLLERYPNTITIGLTATPYRLDGRGLGDVYDAIVAPIGIPELQKQGYLTPVRYFGTPKDLEPKTDDVKTIAGDYDQKALYLKFDQRELYAGVVSNYQRFANGTRAIVFNINVEHSQKTMEAFRAAGISCYHVDGETPRAERESLLKRFRNAEFDVLCNVNLLTEGFDLPAIECVLLNRKTKSKALYLQMVGRGLRPAPGKDCCLVIDQGGNVREFGPVEHPEEHALEMTADRKKGGGAKGAPPMKSCPMCEELHLLNVRECGCGHFFSSASQELKQEEFMELTSFLPATVKLKAPKPEVPVHLRKAWISMSEAELREYAHLMGHKPGWVYHQLQRQRELSQAA
ncbi:DEAD/DEAH box helicase [Hymenobacter sp. HD11105]